MFLFKLLHNSYKNESWFYYANHSLTVVFVVQTVVIQMVISTPKNNNMLKFYYDKTS